MGGLPSVIGAGLDVSTARTGEQRRPSPALPESALGLWQATGVGEPIRFDSWAAHASNQRHRILNRFGYGYPYGSVPKAARD